MLVEGKNPLVLIVCFLADEYSAELHLLVDVFLFHFKAGTMTAEGDNVRTKSFKKQKTKKNLKTSLSFTGSLLGGKVFVFIV